ncbi:MAG: polysaccharide pyruvyl transferase family protein [Thermoleophilia bacterium]|nr:polysaccharide pyruvyl transferase family protein [Thermoleophilia bacterium]
MSKRAQRILITGAGYANKGAEAMLRTAQAELGRRLPGSEFLLWRPEPLEVPLAEAGGPIPVLLPFDVPGRRGARLRRYAGRLRAKMTAQPWDGGCAQYLDADPGLFDVLIDVSGYAYGDPVGRAGYERMAPLARHCRRHRKPVFFLPQAWGPFETPQSRAAIVELLGGDNVSHYARDEESARHLASALATPGPAASPDPAAAPGPAAAPVPEIAFLFQGGTESDGVALLRQLGCTMERPVVGLTPNTRVCERVAGRDQENEYVRTLVTVARHCLDEWDVDLVLQPNELLRSGEGADLELCRLIAEAVARPRRTFVAGDYLSAEAVYSLVGRFELLIGSRFHTLVFALAQGVPAFALGWSHKYRELFSSFGWSDEVGGHLAMDPGELIRGTDRVWAERVVRRAQALAVVPRLRSRVEHMFDEVAGAIGDRP